MNSLLIFIILVGFASIVAMNMAYAQCAPDPSNTRAPCYDNPTILVIKPHEAKMENVNGELFMVVGPFNLQRESSDRIRLDGTEFTYPYYPVPVMPGGVMSVKIAFNDGIKESVGRVGPPTPFVEFTEHQDPKAGIRRNADGTFNFLLSVKQQLISPLKQIKSGIALFDVQCNEGKYLVYKYNKMRASCVNGETETELINRGWALMRLGFSDNTRTDLSEILCGNYEGKWHPEHNGCRGDISDLQCSLMDGEFVDGLKICYNDICPENKTYTLCVTNSGESTPEPPPAPTQCRPGLPSFTSNFYLDKELCKWKLIPEPIPDEAIPYVWNSYLQKMQIDFSPKERSYFNFGEGFNPEKENRVCSPLILSNGSEIYISSTFTIEPFEIIDTALNEIQLDGCYKIWKTESLLVEPSPELGAWLKNYWEKENED